MSEFRSTADAQIARIAGRQHGVVTLAQIEATGIDKDGVTWRLHKGRLHRLHRGVYAVGHRSLSWRGRWLAAVLALGDGAVLSHSSAAALWQFLRPIAGPIHVTVPSTRRPKPRDGIVIHRSRLLRPIDPTASPRPANARARPVEATDRRRPILTRRHGIAVTNPARTIEDVRGELAPWLFRRALRQAELAGHRVPHLGTTGRTRSDLELLFLTLCGDRGLPRPEVNVRVAGLLVDFVFREAQLVVETDSWEYHRGSVAFEDDHGRELKLRAEGFAVRRYTGEQLETAPDAVAADLRLALGLGA